MQLSQVRQPINAATASLLAFGLCVAYFLPPFSTYVSHSVLANVAVGLTIAVSLVLHFAFVCIAAKRLGRSMLGWTLLLLFTFPIGSIVMLVLIEWLADTRNADDQALPRSR